MVVTAIASRGSCFQMSAGNLWKPQHNATTDEFRALFEDAGSRSPPSTNSAVVVDEPTVRRDHSRHQRLILPKNGLPKNCQWNPAQPVSPELNAGIRNRLYCDRR